ALSSPAVARGGGHHHGECGEHHVAYECGNPNYKEWHHPGHGEHYFEDHHPSPSPRKIQYLRGPGRAPIPPDPPQAPAQPKELVKPAYFWFAGGTTLGRATEEDRRAQRCGLR